MKQANAILGLLAQTSIHAGTGSNTGVIDLPIQREAHTAYPCVFGSSMKGALRSHAEQYLTDNEDKDAVFAVFGADNQADNTYAGALMVSDARLVLLPIRSLTSQFKWVTSPYALQRLADDLARFSTGLSLKLPSDVLTENQAWTAQKQPEDLFLEEYRFKTTVQDDLSTVIKVLAKLMKRKTGVEEQLKQQLVVVSDDMFSHLVQHTTPVNAHIAIESDTKVVKGGALWYEETLPPESLLYVGLAANKARKQDSKLATADDVLGTVTELFTKTPWLQIGGNETVGMGWCAVSVLEGAKA
jgi:CRISPR-associated protein Cmr4